MNMTSSGLQFEAAYCNKATSEVGRLAALAVDQEDDDALLVSQRNFS